MCERLLQGGADRLHQPVLKQEADLALGGVHIHIHVRAGHPHHLHRVQGKDEFQQRQYDKAQCRAPIKNTMVLLDLCQVGCQWDSCKGTWCCTQPFASPCVANTRAIRT